MSNSAGLDLGERSEARYGGFDQITEAKIKLQSENLDSALTWMTLAKAAPHKHEAQGKNQSLPDLDIHPARDEGGKYNPSEELLDDLSTVLRQDQKGQLEVKTDKATKLSKDPSDKGELPLLKSDELEEGRIGILINKSADGHTYYTPFISGSADKGLKPNSSMSINESAARELHIDKDLKKGGSSKLDLIILPEEKNGALPSGKDDLHELIIKRIHELAEDARDKDAEKRALEDAKLPEAPKPDPDFGYRRTERSAAELQAIADRFAKIARESMDASDPNGLPASMKEFGIEAQKDVDKYQDQINKRVMEMVRIKREEKELLRQEKSLGADPEKRSLLQVKKDANEDKTKRVDDALLLAQYKLSYAQAELKISKDAAAFTRHMQARASAAVMMSLNPDMEGSLVGHRIAVNSGHWAGDPQFPGFEKDGTAEWKLNFESQDVLAEMIKFAGGSVKLVNQIDLPKNERGMTGLANAIKAAKPEIAVAIHHDDGEKPNDPAMKGTLTLQCSKSTGEWTLDFAKAVHMAKLNYAGLNDRVNAKGNSVGIREQCGRGIQGHNVDAPFILDEQFSTHKDEWDLARDPKSNAKVQLAHIISFYEYLNQVPRYKNSPATAKEWNDKIWSKTHLDDVWKKHPKVGSW
ncbi:MAG: N-acetylmuramoyl-L-alanine amidase [Candidatus Obscuribacterales bacterium]|nr:N-acetylmuramoyl-L-alanine amidase [Candidatus Obscuribacterales bacterium]